MKMPTTLTEKMIKAMHAHMKDEMGGMKAPVKGYALGGMIPGQVNPGGDDTVINAKQGEYILPVEVVQALGKDKLDALVSTIQKSLGNPGPNTVPGVNFDGGLLGGDYGNFGGLGFNPVDEVSKGLKDRLNPDYQPPIQLPNYNINGLANPQTIGATIDNGQNVTPVYNLNANPNVGTPLTPDQNAGLMQAWQREQAMRTATPPVPVSYQAPGAGKTIALVSPQDNGQMPAFMHPAGVQIPAGLSQQDFRTQADTASAIGKAGGNLSVPDKNTVVVGSGQQMAGTPEATATADIAYKIGHVQQFPEGRSIVSRMFLGGDPSKATSWKEVGRGDKDKPA